ncbi:MAG: citrate synthase/methylcitrate synthase [Polyangiaceae bacterium]|nr:citrate synthase/methylcitrate synthase [Polyangiaceae bacterium]
MTALQEKWIVDCSIYVDQRYARPKHSSETFNEETVVRTHKNCTASGLEGVVVAQTDLSEVDGEAGRLIIGDHSIEDLTGHVSFEDVCALLWNGALPSDAARAELQDQLGKARVAAASLLPNISAAVSLPDGMDALRTAVAHLPLLGDVNNAAVVGAAGVFAAAWQRRQQGLAAVPPDPSLPFAADYLRMITGVSPTESQTRGMNAYLVTVSDHGLNASTFAARVTTSTGSDLVSSIVAAICTLKGPLHGGAPGPVLDMLDAIGTPENAAAWIENELRSGRRIMGMGHRIYRVRDPRAAVLERAVSSLEQAGLSSSRLALARAVERVAESALAAKYPDRPLRANVEFYTAVLLDSVGLPRTLFSPTFGVSRSAGWCAHVAEQRAVGKLIRPASRYVGAVQPVVHA